MNSSTGLYTAPGSSGLATVRVEDSSGNKKEALVTILNPLSISPPTISLLKNGTLTFTASGGAGPYSFSVASGSGSIHATTGVFSAPATAGTTTVRVTDSLGNLKDASVVVYEGLSISPFTRSLAVQQTFTFTASGGVSPYTYSLFSGVGSVSASGAYSSSIAGTAIVRVTDSAGNSSDASAGDYKAPMTSASAVVRVTDSDGTVAEAMVTVNDALAISPVSAVVAAGSTQNFIATGGVSPYAYNVVSGGGSFTGSTYTAPSIASGASVSILVTDVLGNTANASITVNPITVSITSPNSSTTMTNSTAAAFPVSGTCSDSGRPVALSATDGTHAPITGTLTCFTGTWSGNLNLSSLNDTSITITANHSNINSVAATSATVTLTKDGSLPTITITSPAASSYVGNSIAVSGTCTKSGLVTLSTASGAVTAITSCVSNAYSATMDASSAVDGVLTITASPTNTTTYNLTFTATGSPVEYCILENSTTVGACSWQSVALPTTFTVSSINEAKVLTAWLRDAAGNVSALANSNSVTLDTQAPAAPSAISLSDPTASPGVDATPSFLIAGVSAGDTVSIYTDSACLVGNLKGTATVSTGTSAIVTSSSLSAGSYSFYAQRTSAAGNSSNCSTATVAYQLDLTAATITNVTASGNGPFKAGDTFTIFVQFTKVVIVTGTPVLDLTTTRLGAQASYNSGSGSGTLEFTYLVVAPDTSADLTYAATNSLTLAGGTIKDNAGNNLILGLPTIGGAGSLSANQSIVIDTTAPTAPTNLVDGVWMSSTSSSPTITFTAGTDSGAGLLKHQIQVIRSSDSLVMKPWADIISGNTVSGLSLAEGVLYKVQIKAIDNIGNESLVATSDGWTVDTTLPTTPTGLTLGTTTSGVSASPTISWINSTDASGIQSYQAQIHKTSGGVGGFGSNAVGGAGGYGGGAQGGGANSGWTSVAGGGGGYFGGGGASSQAGGGGGSGYIGGTGVSGASTVVGSASTPGGTADADYAAGIAVGGAAAPSGGTTGSTGGNGRVLINCQ